LAVPFYHRQTATGLPEWAHLGDNGKIVLAGKMAFIG
jgi:hypothetical protein